MYLKVILFIYNFITLQFKIWIKQFIVCLLMVYVHCLFVLIHWSFSSVTLSQCCQVRGFPGELGYFYTVAAGNFCSPQIEATPPQRLDFFQHFNQHLVCCADLATCLLDLHMLSTVSFFSQIKIISLNLT